MNTMTMTVLEALDRLGHISAMDKEQGDYMIIANTENERSAIVSTLLAYNTYYSVDWKPIGNYWIIDFNIYQEAVEH